ncbi:hypothetical protein AGLY_017936 [Aphis glycines]|uniref:Tc1-like transposase DDE domain-containing protein n=1 Tax=Aphis glycines TaxID=307491 RepID=A0A6G0STB7_APHGL|nr:hypothetical protein AGLY_017936 [Aphis glycines]
MCSEKKDLDSDFFKSAQKIAAQACGISYITVRRICMEMKKSSVDSDEEVQFQSPRKLYKRAKKCSELDDFDADVVRWIIHEFHQRNEYPTAFSILSEIKKKLPYFEGCVRSVRNLLKNLKFTQNEDTRPVVYLDETWVNQNHSRSRIWQNNEETEGFKIPTDKGGRLIITHNGSSRFGFMEVSKFVFKCQAGNSTDYHSSMNSDVFKQWYLDILKLLPEPCVIVMDNEPYHSMLVNNYQKRNARKAEVQEWLKNQNISFSPLEILAKNSRERVNLLKPTFKVKGKVATNNSTFKMVNVERLTHEALDLVSKSDWEKCVKHAETIQDENYQKEILMDSVLESLIITFQTDDSDFGNDEDSEDDVQTLI